MQRGDQVEGGGRGLAEHASEPCRQVPDVRRLAQDRLRVPRELVTERPERLRHRVDDDRVLLAVLRRVDQRLRVRAILVGVTRTRRGPGERVRPDLAAPARDQELRRRAHDHAVLRRHRERVGVGIDRPQTVGQEPRIESAAGLDLDGPREDDLAQLPPTDPPRRLPDGVPIGLGGGHLPELHRRERLGRRPPGHPIESGRPGRSSASDEASIRQVPPRASRRTARLGIISSG